jgi:cytochrome c biogenesis protein CcmG/thiol:disulfide interchange protein DsbE
MVPLFGQYCDRNFRRQASEESSISENLNMPSSISPAGAFMAIAMVGALAACSSSSQMRAAATGGKERKTAPDFALTDSSGATVRLSDYAGKVVLLNFWATWCGPCKVEIPWFIEFERRYKDQGFAVLGVSMDEDGWKAVKPFAKEERMNYRVMLGNERVAQLYGGIDSLPTTFIIGRNGEIASEHNGLVGRNNYEAEILRLLEIR